MNPPRPRPPATPAGPARLAWLFAAPHRLAFAAAAALFGGSALWWALALLAPWQGLAPRWGLPPTQVHGLVMALGFIPLFFCGFLYTAGPRWLGRPPVASRALLQPVAAQLAGWFVFMLAAHGPDTPFGQALGGVGLAAVALGWTQAWWGFVRLLRASRSAERSHARVIAVAGGIGVAVMGWAAAGVFAGEPVWVRAATQLGLWGFVGVVFAAVAHRMIPFFSAAALPVLDAWRPQWLLWSLVAVLGVEALIAVADAVWWPQPGWLRWLQAGFEAAAGFALLALALRWGLVQSLKLRLLAMLHLGFVWFGLALLLSAVSHALLALDSGSLGLAPLHAYTMGFLGSTLIAMVTRVSCGHGGRTLAADGIVWALFWLLQAAVLLRVAAALLGAAGIAAGSPLLGLAALAWAGACVTWSLRYGRWYLSPRADGRPG